MLRCDRCSLWHPSFLPPRRPPRPRRRASPRSTSSSTLPRMAGQAEFYHALERGYFREAGLDVTVEPSKGSADAITRTASQAADIGIGDISTLVEFASRRPEIAPKALFILHNRSPQAVISLKSSGISKLTDLHGRILGQGPADAPSRMFPAVANIAGLDMSRIEVRQFSPQLRDTMLVTKQVDAVTGFEFDRPVQPEGQWHSHRRCRRHLLRRQRPRRLRQRLPGEPRLPAGQARRRQSFRPRGRARLARCHRRPESRP